MQKLYDVVFGQNEFEKTKIEVRFEIIETLLTTLSISSLEDFEFLESCLYKIKDQLRVKSSNLNKVIRDPQKSLSKKKVFQVVDHLMLLRNKFLHNAFSTLEKPITLDKEETLSSTQESVKQSTEIKKEIKEEQTIDQLDEVIDPVKVEESKQNSFTMNPLLFENENYSIVLHTSSSPYLKVQFKENQDFPLLRDLSSLLFELVEAHGTNIIIDGLKALVVPRYINDSILTPLSQDKGIDVDIAYNKLSSLLSPKEKTLKNDYAQISEVSSQNNKNPKDDSLDALLSDIEKKEHDPTPKPNPNSDPDTINIEKGDSIEIERKPPEIFNDEITIIKEESSQEKQDNFAEEKSSNETNDYLIYGDDQIEVQLNQSSKVLGEILISHKSGNSYGELNESELSYISIFTKIFSSVLFETLQAHGTNVFWSTKDKSLHIVPRFQEDKLNFEWKPTQHSEEFLEQIKSKLLSIMGATLSNTSQEEPNNQEKKAKISSKDKSIDEKEDISKKNKAKYILEELRKIP